MKDGEFMLEAFAEARRGLGMTSPNPVVGAVVVKDGRIEGRGFHAGPGQPHAEVMALAEAAGKAIGAELFVTLEPCNHEGRTPPCTNAIKNAGIARVVFAVEDPNPNVKGGGASALREAGIEVEEGIMQREAAYLNRFFLHHARTGIPWVLLKYAASLDGRTATRTGKSKWITSEKSRSRVHRLRHDVDAILVGIETILADDPLLTARNPKEEYLSPLRIVVDSKGRIPMSARALGQDAPTLIATTDAMSDEKQILLESASVRVVRLPSSSEGRVDVRALLRFLGERQLQSLLIEGGATISGAFLDLGAVDEVWAFMAPILIGGERARPAVGGEGAASLEDRLQLEGVIVEPCGPDTLIRGYATGSRNRLTGE